MKQIQSLLIAIASALLLPIRGSEDKGDLATDLMKSLDELEAQLEKSEKKESKKEDDKEDSDEDEKDEEDDKKSEKEDEDESEDDEDESDDHEDKETPAEEKAEEKAEKKGKKKDLKKSIDDAVSAHAELVDANEVLKSFVSVLSKTQEAIERLEAKFAVQEEMTKSLASVVSKSTRLLKSTKEEVAQIGSAPVETKGKKEALAKSEEAKPKVTHAVVRDLMIKSFQDGKIRGEELSRWEISGYKFEYLPESVRADLVKLNA